MTTTRNRAHHLGLKLQDEEGKNHVNTLHRERAGGRKTGTATRRNDFVRLFSTLTFERTVRPVGAGALAGSRERGGGSQAHRLKPVWLNKNVRLPHEDGWGRMDKENRQRWRGCKALPRSKDAKKKKTAKRLPRVGYRLVFTRRTWKRRFFWAPHRDISTLIAEYKYGRREQTLSRPKRSRLKRLRGAVFHRRRRCQREREKESFFLYKEVRSAIPSGQWACAALEMTFERGSHLVKEERTTVKAGGTELRTTTRGTTGTTGVRSIGSLLLPYVVATRLKTRATLIRPASRQLSAYLQTANFCVTLLVRSSLFISSTDEWALCLEIFPSCVTVICLIQFIFWVNCTKWKKNTCKCHFHLFSWSHFYLKILEVLYVI